MSDPMTNTDVEDVLASIRRLVSDNKRPDVRSVQQPPSDRLVLTPSLRVPEADDTDEPEQGTEELEAADLESDVEGDALSRFAESAFAKEQDRDEQKLDVRSKGFVPADASAVVATLSADLTRKPVPVDEPDFDVEDEVEAEAEIEVAEDEFDEDALSEGENLLSDDEPMESDDESELIASADAASDPEETDDDTASGEDAHVPEDWANEVEAVTSVPDADEQDAETEVQTAEPGSQSLSEKIAALETLVGDRRDQFEPDDPGTDAYAGTEPPAMEWIDADADEDAPEEAEAGVVEAEDEAAFEATETLVSEQEIDEPQAAAQTPAASEDDIPVAPTSPFSSDDDVLDEEAMRELISDIVREELQGALGERITRNVRKLVRREIHRALAAQDLE